MPKYLRPGSTSGGTLALSSSGGHPGPGVNVLLILDTFPAKKHKKWQWDKRFSNRRYSKDHPNVEGLILGFLVIWTTFALCNIFYLKSVWPHPQKASSIWNNSWISSIITVCTIFTAILFWVIIITIHASHCGVGPTRCLFLMVATMRKVLVHLCLRTWCHATENDLDLAHTHNTHTWCCPTENSLCRCTYTWRFAIERTLAHVPDAVLLKIHVHLYAYCTLRYWKFTCSQCIDRYWRALKFLRASILVTFQFDLKQDEQKGTVFWNIHVPRNLAAFHTPHTQ